MRVRCDRDVQERPCEGAVRPPQACASVPPHFENFRQGWQKCVAKYGNARPRPKQDKYVCTRSTSVKKERRGFPSRDLIDTNPRFTCQLMRIFFSKDQRANHLTPHRLINAAPCKPTFSLPHACMSSLSLPCPSLCTHAPLALSPVSACKHLSLPWENVKHMGKRDGITAGTHGEERDGGPGWKEQRKNANAQSIAGKTKFS